jgi:hypothetical protein
MTPDTSREHAEGLVSSFLDERLEYANEPPGLRETIIQGVELRGEEIRQRGIEQIRQQRSPNSRRIPDAYLHDEVVLEDELQKGAAGIRTAQALEGALLVDPRRFEHALAGRLASSARWAMRAEASRVPRPPTRPTALGWSLAPIPWVEDDSKWPPPGAVSLDGVRQLAGTDAEPSRVAEEPYSEWVQLGMFEQQGTLRRSYPKAPARQLLIATGLEVFDESPPEGSLPLSGARPIAWTVAHERIDPDLDRDLASTVLATTQGPLAGMVDYDLELGAPHRLRGAGLHQFALAPRFEAVAFLGLRPEHPSVRHVLVDDQGPALVGRVWRGFLIHDGDYTPLVPGVYGGDLIIRQGLYERLEAVVGVERMRFGIMVTHHEHEDPDGAEEL